MIYIAFTEACTEQKNRLKIPAMLEASKGISSLYRLYWQKLTPAGLIHAAEPRKQSGISRGTDPQGQRQNAFSGHPAGLFNAMAITAGVNKSRTHGKP